MGTFNVDLEVVTSLMDKIELVTGDTVQNGMQDLARLVADNDGNEIMAQFTENCKEMQRTYNEDMVPKFTAFVQEMATFEELKAVVAKRAQSLMQTKKVDTDFQVKQIEVPSL